MAKNLVTGFARLGGRAVALSATSRGISAGSIDIDASAKAPVRTSLRLVQSPACGFRGHTRVRARQGAGHGGIRSAANLMYAFCEATVPRLTVIAHRAYDRGFEVMCSKHIRADFSSAWGLHSATAAPSGSLDRQDVASPYDVGVNDVVAGLRPPPRLIAALDACASKREGRPPQEARQHPSLKTRQPRRPAWIADL